MERLNISCSVHHVVFSYSTVCSMLYAPHADVLAIPSDLLRVGYR